jgi:hypothetical protein
MEAGAGTVAAASLAKSEIRRMTTAWITRAAIRLAMMRFRSGSGRWTMVSLIGLFRRIP